MSVTSGSVWHTPASDRDGWSFVVARSFLAAVNAGASSAVLAALWTFADAEDAAVEELVGAIPLASDGGVHSFAIVSFPQAEGESAGERVVTAVVRGAAVVDLFSVGGARRFGAGGMEPWMLADFRSVTAVVLGGDDRPTAPVADAGAGSLPVNSGVVHASRLLWSLTATAFGDDEQFAPGPSERYDPSNRGRHVPEAPRVPEATAGVHPHPEPDDLDATIITAREHPPVSSVDDETVLLSRTGSRSEPADRSEKSMQQPKAGFRYRVATGEPQSLDAPTVFGRNPSAPRVIAGRMPHLVRVESPDAAVSSTHLRLAAEGGAVVVTDLRSTNGTLVTPPGGKRRRLRPGETLVVLAGTRIDIGDGNIIEIMSAEHTLGPADPPEPGKGPA